MSERPDTSALYERLRKITTKAGRIMPGEWNDMLAALPVLLAAVEERDRLNRELQLMERSDPDAEIDRLKGRDRLLAEIEKMADPATGMKGAATTPETYAAELLAEARRRAALDEKEDARE